MDLVERERLYPIGIMIENLTTIRPQPGLEYAHVVYEALAEGGITRFLGIYTLTGPFDKIGPVRSARPYYLDWVKEYGALYAHAGGSPEAMSNIRQQEIFDLDQFFNAPYYWRSTDAKPPHNLFTSSELMIAASRDTKATAPENDTFETWNIKSEEPINAKKKREIVLDFSTYNYEVRYLYNPETNAYARSNGGKMHLDKTSGAQLQVKNIIVQRAQTNLIEPRSGLLGIQTEGTGEAFFFLDGKKIEGRWERTSDKKRTYFYDATRNSIAINPGPTWIEILPPDRVDLYTEK
jgi:hypothetical protein